MRILGIVAVSFLSGFLSGIVVENFDDDLVRTAMTVTEHSAAQVVDKAPRDEYVSEEEVFVDDVLHRVKIRKKGNGQLYAKCAAAFPLRWVLTCNKRSLNMYFTERHGDIRVVREDGFVKFVNDSGIAAVTLGQSDEFTLMKRAVFTEYVSGKRLEKAEKVAIGQYRLRSGIKEQNENQLSDAEEVVGDEDVDRTSSVR